MAAPNGLHRRHESRRREVVLSRDALFQCRRLRVARPRQQLVSSRLRRLGRGNTGAMGIEVFGGSGTRSRETGWHAADRSQQRQRRRGQHLPARPRARLVGGGQPATNNRIGGPALEDRNVITGFGTWKQRGISRRLCVQIFDAAALSSRTTPSAPARTAWPRVTLRPPRHPLRRREPRYDHQEQSHRRHSRPRPSGALLRGRRLGNLHRRHGHERRDHGQHHRPERRRPARLGSVTGIAAANYYLGPVAASASEVQRRAGQHHRRPLLDGNRGPNPVDGVRVSGNSIYGNGTLGIA